MTFVSLTAVQITYQTFVVNVIFTELVSFLKIVDAFSSDKTQKKIESLPHDPRNILRNNKNTWVPLPVKGLSSDDLNL